MEGKETGGTIFEAGTPKAQWETSSGWVGLRNHEKRSILIRGGRDAQKELRHLNSRRKEPVFRAREKRLFAGQSLGLNVGKETGARSSTIKKTEKRRPLEEKKKRSRTKMTTGRTKRDLN